jgi:transposase-like protein
MPRSSRKRQLLRQEGALNLRADAVTDELFQQSEFFDPADSVQVKYEMLRQVQIEGQPVSETARSFGFSRPSFYQAQAAFQEAGLVGLLPHKRGPRGGHKLTAEVMDFVIRTREQDASLSWEQIGRLIRQRFPISIHPRSIARQWSRQKKRS